MKFFILLFFSVGFAQAETSYYLKPSEKAIIALALRAAQATPDEQTYIIKSIFDRIRIAEMSEQKKQQMIEVASFKEFITAQQNINLFESAKLIDLNIKDLLNEIKAIQYFSETPSVQKRIDRYFEKRNEALKNIIVPLALESFNAALQSKNTNQDFKIYITNVINEKINDFTERLNKTENSEANSQINPQTLVMSKLLKAYFINLPKNQKIEIIYQLSQIPINSNPMDIFLVMIQNSGPNIQKLLQIIGRSASIPAEFQDVFQRLESQVKSVPWRDVRELVESEGLQITDFNYFEHTPIGVGTMAQTHRIQLTDSNGLRQSLVLRFLKPKIDELLQMDYEILKVTAHDIDNDPELKKFKLPSLVNLVDDLHKSVLEELNLNRTILDQNKAQKIYSKAEYIKFNSQKNKLQFTVPKTYALGKNKKLMIQELIFGQKPYKELAQYKDIYPDLYKVIAEKTAELWLSEAFFKSGFFHADLHQGNMMMQLNESEIKVNLLDFGMTGSLNSEQQKSAILLGLGIQMNHPQLILKHLVALSKTQKAPDYLKKQIQDRCDQIKKSEISSQTLADWIAWSLDQGLDLNYEFLKLNRGITAIDILLTDAKSDLSFEDIIQNLALKNKIYIAEILLKEKNLKTKDYPELLAMMRIQNEKPKSCEALF